MNINFFCSFFGVLSWSNFAIRKMRDYLKDLRQRRIVRTQERNLRKAMEEENWREKANNMEQWKK